ncbi:MAG: hypothetical protein HC819_08715 [Cyclobacteriaceae bacterium]|nr:hypothetical protein [Cyclobacteriaceae bacterium]
MTTLLFIGGIGFFELILLLLIQLLWLWALIDSLSGNFKGNTKLFWIVAIILLPWLGAILYFIIGRSQKINYVAKHLFICSA